MSSLTEYRIAYGIVFDERDETGLHLNRRVILQRRPAGRKPVWSIPYATCKPKYEDKRLKEIFDSLGIKTGEWQNVGRFYRDCGVERLPKTPIYVFSSELGYSNEGSAIGQRNGFKLASLAEIMYCDAVGTVSEEDIDPTSKYIAKYFGPRIKSKV
jgi:hypothetical protein